MPMAANILSRGFELHVYNRTRSKAEALATQGARVADSTADLTQGVDILLACLPDIEACEEVFLGKEGAIRVARPGQILVDHSTVDPKTSARLHEAAKERGTFFLDAPVSGGPAGAEAGTLIIMVGGDKEAFHQALPVFQAMGKTIPHMGGPGSGTVAKLANQILVGIQTLASCEAMLLALRSGVDTEKLAQVLLEAWGGSKMLERNAPLILRRAFGPSAVPIRNLVKDLAIIVELGRKMGLRLPCTRQAERINRIASSRGMALQDITAVYQLLETDAGTGRGSFESLKVTVKAR